MQLGNDPAGALTTPANPQDARFHGLPLLQAADADADAARLQQLRPQ
jgi:hypothetical protein